MLKKTQGLEYTPSKKSVTTNVQCLVDAASPNSSVLNITEPEAGFSGGIHFLEVQIQTFKNFLL